jgi:non-ribosomal peptide synthetase component F
LSDTLDEQYTIPCGEHVIGYSVPRNEQMIIVPLSIAKAGMTAMPLDSSYPAERLEFMRGDATKYDGKGAFILLYTSGTTGTPKGVMLSEENILAFCEFHTQLVGMTPESRYATYAGYGFDAFMHDLWSCMYVGCAIYVIAEDIRFDLDGMHDYFEQEEITHTFMTTQVATQMAINYPTIKGLKVLGTGGEKLMSLNPPSYRLMNYYGPTETTVYVTHFEVKENEPNIPIGYPNSHVELFIVNKQGKRVPWGAAGELLIAGPQVGIGYLNQSIGSNCLCHLC